MKLKIFISILLIAAAAFLVFSQKNEKDTAEDFPREALVYVRIADLKGFLKLWNESALREKYTASENYEDFTKRHLGLKLAGRWQEFNDAAGFPIDSDALSGLAENQASIALYDIGKLEFVFIAPISDEIFAATKFVGHQANFSEETLEDGTIVYRAKVEADRGRQNQELIFTNLKGRFVVATSEKLFVQTMKNINGDKAKNRLTDEPSFTLLREKIEPHTWLVWVNQTVLNDDYYFKRYWLMSNAENLKNIRAGIFDFEMREGKFIERRKFLLGRAVVSAPVNQSETAEMLAYIPIDTPFYTLRSVDPQAIDEAVENTIFRRRQAAKTKPERRRYSSSSFSDNDDYSYYNYYSLGEKFDETIDEDVENETIERPEINVDFSELLRTAAPGAVLTFTRPKVLPAPLFVEFGHAAIFRLAAPAALNRASFESSIEKNLSDKVMISSPGANLKWETKTENGASWRELKLPMLEWKIIYLVRGNELILTDDAELLTKILAAKNSPAEENSPALFDKLTVLNLDQRENAYDGVFSELPDKNIADDFFTGNIKSLLDSLSEVKKITIKEHSSQNIIDQEITVDGSF